MRRVTVLITILGFGALASSARPHGAVEPMRRGLEAEPPSQGAGPPIDPVYVHFEAPTLEGKRRLVLWATHYSVARARATRAEGSVPLLDMEGRAVGPRVSVDDFCRAALEGTVQVTDGRGGRRLYDYAGLAPEMQVDCTHLFPRYPALGRSRFRRSYARYGEGSRGLHMVPFRTIAVDRDVIPLGTVLYVPAARGTPVTLDDGTTHLHDGYFYAADTGGAIDGNHVDVFVGLATKNPFPFVKSRETGTFEAYVVEAPAVREVFASAHARGGLAQVAID